MEGNTVKIGERIRQARKLKRITQEQLAQSIGVSDKSISAYESERIKPPLPVLEKIAESTNQSISFFIEMTEDMDVLAKLHSVEAELKEIMQQFGYAILKALVTDINPDDKVKQAMNEINAATRLRVAATQKGEAEKIIRIKQAEGEAESMRLQGEGLANARKAIIGGMSSSVSEFKQIAPEVSAKDIMTLVLMSQYCDTLKEIGAKSSSNSVFLASSPANISDLESQIRNGLLTANTPLKKSN